MGTEKVDESFGIIPLIREANVWKLLLVHHKKGHWGIPKGHKKILETSKQAAERELLEETNLVVKQYLFQQEIFQEKYQYEENGQAISKVVQYFPAEVEGIARAQPSEILSLEWFSLANAVLAATFSESKQLIQKITQNLEKNNV